MSRDPRKPTTKDEELLEAESLTIVSELDDAARIARIDGELRDGFEALAHIGKAVSFFGSARTPADDPGYAAARSLARRMGDAGFAVITGGGPGIMEAANRGATDVGAPSIGLNITLPHEQYPNSYSTPELTFRFHYFAMRKMHFAMRASALVVFPGGFGTLDELFELLTLRQTDKSPPLPIVLFDEGYWRSVINFEALIEHGMIAREDLGLFRFAETPEQVWECLLAGGLRPYEDLPEPPPADLQDLKSGGLA